MWIGWCFNREHLILHSCDSAYAESVPPAMVPQMVNVELISGWLFFEFVTGPCGGRGSQHQYQKMSEAASMNASNIRLTGWSPSVMFIGLYEWEFQDPKMEVLYHIRQYFGGISPYIGLTWALYMVGTSNLGS